MWLFKIIREAFSFFVGLFKSSAMPSSPTIQSPPPPITGGRKKFQVLGESEIRFRTPSEIRTNNTSDEVNRFKMHGTTMPKVCPLCGTENRTTRSQNNNREWHCKECQYEW